MSPRQRVSDWIAGLLWTWAYRSAMREQRRAQEED